MPLVTLDELEELRAVVGSQSELARRIKSKKQTVNKWFDQPERIQPHSAMVLVEEFRKLGLTATANRIQRRIDKFDPYGGVEV